MMALLKQCLVCRRLTDQSRCPDHLRRRQGTQGTTTERGLGADHRRLGTEALIAAGADEHGIGGRCAICGGPGVLGNPLERDHVRPRAFGGRNERANYRAVHMRCNRRRNARPRRRTT